MQEIRFVTFVRMRHRPKELGGDSNKLGQTFEKTGASNGFARQICSKQASAAFARCRRPSGRLLDQRQCRYHVPLI
jgi:hypothetical protein